MSRLLLKLDEYPDSVLFYISFLGLVGWLVGWLISASLLVLGSLKKLRILKVKIVGEKGIITDGQLGS